MKDDTEKEETIEDDANEEETIKDDETETETEQTEEGDNDTVASVPLKRPTGTDLGLGNLTTAPVENLAVEKVIFASCHESYSRYGVGLSVICNVPGATPGDYVVASSTPLDKESPHYSCRWIISAQVIKPDVVRINVYWCDELYPAAREATYSIIVFRLQTPY